MMTMEEKHAMTSLLTQAERTAMAHHAADEYIEGYPIGSMLEAINNERRTSVQFS
jgi:hypothetical protein